MNEKELKQLKVLLDKAFKFGVIKPRTSREDMDLIYTELKDFTRGTDKNSGRD